jgi:hypothetical protein
MFNTFGQAGGLGGFGAQAAAPAAGTVLCWKFFLILFELFSAIF